MTLTKILIADSIHDQTGFSKRRCAEIVDSFFESIKKTLESGEDVLISGFGKFCVREKRQRLGRNPQTGEDLTLESRRVVTFKCSDRLRDKMNGKG